MQALIARDTPGYAIGGLVGGEEKSVFVRIVAQCTARLPPGKPRYVMGVGCCHAPPPHLGYVAFSGDMAMWLPSSSTFITACIP